MITATHNPSAPTEYLPAYDSGDHLHPNNAGDQAIGNAVSLGLLTQPNVPVISLKAVVNGDYVTVGSTALIASSTTIGTAQKFDLIKDS